MYDFRNVSSCENFKCCYEVARKGQLVRCGEDAVIVNVGDRGPKKIRGENETVIALCEKHKHSAYVKRR